MYFIMCQSHRNIIQILKSITSIDHRSSQFTLITIVLKMIIVEMIISHSIEITHLPFIVRLIDQLGSQSQVDRSFIILVPILYFHTIAFSSISSRLSYHCVTSSNSIVRISPRAECHTSTSGNLLSGNGNLYILFMRLYLYSIFIIRISYSIFISRSLLVFSSHPFVFIPYICSYSLFIIDKSL